MLRHNISSHDTKDYSRIVQYKVFGFHYPYHSITLKRWWEHHKLPDAIIVGYRDYTIIHSENETLFDAGDGTHHTYRIKSKEWFRYKLVWDKHEQVDKWIFEPSDTKPKKKDSYKWIKFIAHKANDNT